MTDKITNQEKLMDIINNNNVSIDFLKSSFKDEAYHTVAFNHSNFFWRFDVCCENFFQLLQMTEEELLVLSGVGEQTMNYLSFYLSKYNCTIGMFKDFSLITFNALTNQKIRLEDLTPEEKSLSLTLINCLVNKYVNDMDLGREIRKIFNQIKS